MTRFELVTAGAGLTAARAIKSYCDAGGGGQIALLARESDLSRIAERTSMDALEQRLVGARSQ